MYQVTIKLYANRAESIKQFPTYKEAVSYAEGASEIASRLQWTRHCSVEGVIKHLDYYSDIYNEGSIILEKE